MTLIHKTLIVKFSSWFTVASLLVAPSLALAQSVPQAGVRESQTAISQQIVFLQLKHANAAAICRLLTQLYKTPASSSDAKPGNIAPTFVCDDRTNTVIVTGSPSIVEAVKQLLAKLDKDNEIQQQKDKDASVDQRLDNLEQNFLSLLKEIKSVREQLPTMKQSEVSK